jgi:hypothetical protein
MLPHGNSSQPSGLPAGRWRGHLPEASVALEALLGRSATGRCEFSPSERALFMACEFWVAVESRDMVRHLGDAPVERLRYQVVVFAAIGAQGVSRALVRGLCELAASRGPVACHRCLEVLEERLGSTQDPVDGLIAGLADRLGISAVPAAAREGVQRVGLRHA